MLNFHIHRFLAQRIFYLKICLTKKNSLGYILYCFQVLETKKEQEDIALVKSAPEFPIEHDKNHADINLFTSVRRKNEMHIAEVQTKRVL